MRTYNISVKYKTFHESAVPPFAFAAFDAAVQRCLQSLSDTMPVLSVWEGSVLQYEVRPHHDGSCEFKTYIPGKVGMEVCRIEDAMKEVFPSAD